jgi:Ala-tRNA(Pro) deacylase
MLKFVTLQIMQPVYDYLKQLGLSYEVHKHPPVFTVEEAAQYRSDIEYGESKNLFLRNKKGSKHYLVTVAASKSVDLKKLGETMGEKLSLASEERLSHYLGLTRGSVSPFGLINDTEKEVTFILDEDLLTYEKLGFHPNINTQTVIVSTEDFKKFLLSTGRELLVEKL